MSSSNKTLTEQVKEAERDKLIAEKRKIEIEIAQSKLFSKKNLISIFSSAFIGITIAWFYYEKIEKYVFDTNSIITAHDNALKTAALDSGIKQLNNEKKIVREDSIKYINLLSALQASQSEKNALAVTNSKLSVESGKIKLDIRVAKDSLKQLRHQKNKLIPIVDSLQNESYINSTENNKLYVVFHFKYEGKDVYPQNVVALTKNSSAPNNKPVIFKQASLPTKDFTMYLFRGCPFVLKMTDPHFKFEKGIFEFETSPYSSPTTQDFEVPVIPK